MKKKTNRYFVEQKLMGLTMILISILAAIVSGEGTVGLIFIPFGILLIVTKKELIYGSSEERN